MYKKYEALRDKAGIRDADVTRATGISSVVLSEWKSGKCNPKVDKLIKIAKFFGVTVEELVED